MDNYWKGCPARMDDARFLTDYRSSTRRELYIKYLNGNATDDAQRLFYQQNGKQIIDREWEILRKTQSCFPNPCVHKLPTRTNTVANIQEMQLYNAVKTGKINPTSKSYPHCQVYEDYRMI